MDVVQRPFDFLEQAGRSTLAGQWIIGWMGLVALFLPRTTLADEPVRVSWETEAASQGSSISVKVERREEIAAFEFDPAKLLVYRIEEERRSSTPMAGKVSVEEQGLRWRPRFPLRLGAVYEAVYQWDSDDSAREVTARLETQASDRAAPQLVLISPSGESVPENLLRIYLEFDQPMARGHVQHRVTLLDSQGKPVELPFLQLDEELWNEAGTRVTLLLDPGRVKRGLRPNEEEGRALVAGHTYRLRVSGEWPSATGIPLGEDQERAWQVTEPDEVSPNWNAWHVSEPIMGTREPLYVRFEAPVDRALAQRLIVIKSPRVGSDEGESIIGGRVIVGEGERMWQFEPAEPWVDSIVRLEVAPELEDPAGNSLQRRFETDLESGEATRDLPVLGRDVLLRGARERPEKDPKTDDPPS